MLHKTILSLFVVAGFASAQPFGAGFKVGLPLNGMMPSSIQNAPIRYTVGPYVELRLPARMAVEVEALYRSYDFLGSDPLSASVGASASSWEFPVLIKHRFAAGPVRPYFDAGVSFSRLSDIRLQTLNHRSNYGVVIGGGLEFNLFLIKVSPEVRYTGWVLRNLDAASVQSKRSQVSILFGFGF